MSQTNFAEHLICWKM